MVRAPYQAVVRLVSYAERYWTAIDGEAASRGTDYFALPLDRWCNAIQWWVSQRVSDPEAFVAGLEVPLDADPHAVTEHDLERDEQAFMAFASAFGVRPPTTTSDVA